MSDVVRAALHEALVGEEDTAIVLLSVEMDALMKHILDSVKADIAIVIWNQLWALRQRGGIVLEYRLGEYERNLEAYIAQRQENQQLSVLQFLFRFRKGGFARAAEALRGLSFEELAVVYALHGDKLDIVGLRLSEHEARTLQLMKNSVELLGQEEVNIPMLNDATYTFVELRSQLRAAITEYLQLVVQSLKIQQHAGTAGDHAEKIQKLMASNRQLIKSLEKSGAVCPTSPAFMALQAEAAVRLGTRARGLNLFSVSHKFVLLLEKFSAGDFSVEPQAVVLKLQQEHQTAILVALKTIAQAAVNISNVQAGNGLLSVFLADAKDAQREKSASQSPPDEHLVLLITELGKAGF